MSRGARWMMLGVLVVVIGVAATFTIWPRTGSPADAAARSAATGATANPSPAATYQRPAAASRPSAATSGPPARKLPLAGKTVGIDPGHNGGNAADPAFLAQRIWNGRAWENCDTTGTSTDSGYTEARFTFQVASYLRADLRRDGARVVLTRTSNHGTGPCVNRRSWIINDAHASVAIDIHADGGPASGRGFTILEPVRDGRNDAVIGSSDRFGAILLRAFQGTGMPVSDYYGHDGIIARDDLAGLNLTTVPKVLIECGNMRNATDARLLTSTRFQRAAAHAMEAAIIRFLAGQGR